MYKLFSGLAIHFLKFESIMAAQAQGLKESYFNISDSLYLELIVGRKWITTPFNRGQGKKLI